MKNKFNFLLILAIVIFVALGCSRLTSGVQKSVSGDNSSVQNSNKSLVDQTTEDIADGETTGIPECDEVAKIFSDYAKNDDDSFITKATKDFFIGQFKKSFRESLEENKNDKKKMAEQCRDYKKQLQAKLKEEQQKKK